MNSSAVAASASAVKIPSLSPPHLLRRIENTVYKPAERIPALDGLRGIAILLVLLRHSVAGAETTSPFWSAMLIPLRLTWSGVDLFFVLSGFLIGGILLDARNSRRYFKTFYMRRAFRILPVYVVFILLYLGRHLPVPALSHFVGDTSRLPIPWLSFLTFTQNFWMVAFGWFGPMAIAPTWSLAVEEQFYLTIPFLIRRAGRTTLYISLLLTIVGAPFLRAMLPHLINHGGFGCYVLMPCRADALCMGVMAALLVRSESCRVWITAHRWVLYVVTGFTFLGIVFLTYWAPEQYAPPMSTWGLTCLAIFYTSVLLSVICGNTPWIENLLTNSTLMKLGTLAYCTYLIHSSVIEVFRSMIRSHSHLSPAEVWAFGGILGVMTALLIASLSWKFFEQPFLRMGHQYTY
jgi:peptidoglycan/LPS O-acetylase OafA/YrhL